MKAVMPATEFDDEITSVVATLGSLVRAPAIVTASATPIAELRRMLAQRRVPAIAIVDRDELRGIVTRTDVLRAEPDATAADVMSGFVFALPASAAIEKAAALMAYEGVGQVVVVGDGGALVGMVSAVDIARHLAVIAGYLRE